MATKQMFEYPQTFRNVYETRNRYSGTWSEWQPIIENITYERIASTVTAEFSRPRPPFPSNTPLIKNVLHDNRGMSYASETGAVQGYNQGRARGSRYFVLSTLYDKTPGVYKTVTRTTAQGQGNLAFAIGKLNASYTGSHANFGESLSEWRSTSRTIAKRATDALGIYSRLRTRRTAERMLKSAAKRYPSRRAQLLNILATKPWTASGLAAKAYLEVSFMWRPLLADAYALLEFRKKSLSNGRLLRHSRGHVDSDGFTARAGYEGVVTDAFVANLNAYGLANPSLTAWQVTRLSFVFDWVFNLSNALAAITAGMGWSYSSGWSVTMTGTIRSYSIAGETSRDVNFSRAVVNSITPVKLATFLVREDNHIASKLATFAALIRGGAFK